ncbi:MAG: tetratricopeptide repeat protein [Planctomycetota bacterium]
MRKPKHTVEPQTSFSFVGLTSSANTVRPATISGRAGTTAGSRTRHPSGFARFEIGRELGAGAMGHVVLASDPLLHRDCAIKRLHPEADIDDAASRFVAEAQITGQLEHPNIVPVHELGFDDGGMPWLAMKRVHGVTLADVIHTAREAGEPLRPADIQWIIDVVGKICDAVGFASQRGVVHRDLKPANIMVGAFGEVLVMDWGLARPTDDVTGSKTPLKVDRRDASPEDQTLDGDVCGTPAYMAPEQANGMLREIDGRTDIFGVGAILYALLALHSPYPGDSVYRVLVMAASHKLRSPRAAAPSRGIPRELDAIVMKAMAHARADRYQTAQELKLDLQAYREFRPLQARRDGAGTKVLKAVRRHPAIAMTIGTAAVFLVAVGLLISMLQSAESRAAGEQALRELQAERAQRAEARAAADRARLDLQAERASRAEFELLARQGEVDALVERLGGTLKLKSRELIEHFIAQHDSWRAVNPDADQASWIGSLNPAVVDQTLAAFREYFAAATEHPDRIKLVYTDWFYHGVLLDLGKQQYADALPFYDEALRLEPRLRQAWSNRAACNTRLRRFADVLRDGDEMLRIAEDATAHCVRARALNGLGRPAEALEAANRALQLDPARVWAFTLRGEAEKELDHPAAAMADFDRALAIKADDLDALISRANLRRLSNDFRGAMDDTNRALAIRPELVPALISRGAILAQTGDAAGAARDLDRAIDLDGNTAEAWFFRGFLRMSQKEYAKAAADFDRALALKPGDVGTLSNRGLARFNSGDRAGGIADLDEAITRAPRFVSARINRGEIRAALKQYEAAIVDFDAALAADPGRSRVQLMVDRAMALARLGRTDDARRAFADTLAAAPAAQRPAIEATRKELLGE